MYSLQKPILQNPFHPLDLSPQQLLRIYNRFQQSRIINKNPQQQLSIDTISQLISSLKGIKPSYVQKCITQSFIKPTISWNDFLTLLDQQSEVREKILDWVLFFDQGEVVKYRLQKYLPFRTECERSFDFVTFMKIATIGQDKVCIVEVDHEKLFLVDISDNNFKFLDRFMKKNSKMNLEAKQPQIKNTSKVVNRSLLFQPFPQAKKNTGLGISSSNKYQSQKLIGSINLNGSIQGVGNIRSSQLTQSNEDQELYYKKQRKNLHSVFNIFRNLDIDDSIKLAHVTAGKIGDRTFNSVHANSIKDAFGDKMIQSIDKIQQVGSKNIAPFDRAQKKLKSLYQQKQKLSYNPYRIKRSFMPQNQYVSGVASSYQPTQKKLTHQRKQKSYTLQSVALSYCQQISCLAIAYHNMELLILKVGRDLNKVCFQEQDLIKINLERDHKKNQVIESVKFYHHTIRDKWFMLVLIRVQYKGEGKNNVAESYVLGFEVQEIENKRKNSFNYKFKCNRELFSGKKEAFCLTVDKFEGTILEVQPRVGIHLVSFNGKYFTYRQEYIEHPTNPQYWRLSTEEKFKNSNLSLSCISIGSSINKILFGTNNGNIVLYDTFSHQFKIKRVSAHAIVKVQIVGNQGLTLTHDQKINIYNLAKFQEINSFSTVNEDKLHEKVLNFEFEQKTKQIWTFGSQIKIYSQQTDQNRLHKKRQMQKTYTWRLNKLKNQTQPNNVLKERIQVKLKSQKVIQDKKQPELKSSQLIIASERYFVLLSEILEVIVIQKASLKVKFTFILNVPYDSKVMKIAISPSQKLIAILLFNQAIYVYNIYTQELCLYLKPMPNEKFVSLNFLDSKNEYLLAVGTQSGKIALIPYSSAPQKRILYLKYHKNPVNVVQMKNNFLITCCQGGKIGIWQLPFNVIKHQFKLPAPSKYISKLIGFYSNKIIYMKSIDDEIFQINLALVKLNKSNLQNQILDSQMINVMSVDPVTNELFLVRRGNLVVFSKNNETNKWIVKSKIRIFQDKSKKKLEETSEYGEILEIGVVDSQKAVFFYEGGGVFTYSYQTQKVGKYITFNE